MTPAITLLKKNKVVFEVLQYNHDSRAESYGTEAAEKLSLDANDVFKTLVVSDESGKLAVAIVPVSTRLSEKKLAKALTVKKIVMANAEQVMSSTGYVLGGVSPLGQKKRLRTVIHQSAKDKKRVYVSAGKRGVEVALAPNALANLVNGAFADIEA